jgi:hypothetical protein
MLSVEIRIYNGNPFTLESPHSFLVITGPDGVAQSVGFSPVVHGALSGPGNVTDDAGHPWDESSGSVEITQAQYRSLMNYIAATTTNPPDYSVFLGSQCSTWVVNALAQIGMAPDFWVPGMQPESVLADFVAPVVFNPWMQSMGTKVDDLYTATQHWVATRPSTCRDPLAFDLEGDGIETAANKKSSYQLTF